MTWVIFRLICAEVRISIMWLLRKTKFPTVKYCFPIYKLSLKYCIHLSLLFKIPQRLRALFNFCQLNHDETAWNSPRWIFIIILEFMVCQQCMGLQYFNCLWNLLGQRNVLVCEINKENLPVLLRSFWTFIWMKRIGIMHNKIKYNVK